MPPGYDASTQRVGTAIGLVRQAQMVFHATRH